MALMALGLAACVKEVEFDGKQSDPLLVVNGLQQVGRPARLCVEKSVFFLDNRKDCRVKDVEVDLYVNGSFKEALQVRDSIINETYIDWNDGDELYLERLCYAFTYCEGQYILCAGDQLRFEVRSSEFEDTAEAEVTMPDVPNVISFDTVRIDYQDYQEDNLRTVYFSLTLDDPSGTDYYNLSPRDGLVGFISSDPVFTDFSNFELEDLMGESSDYYGNGSYNVINDNYFDGKTYSISMNVYSWGDYFYEPFVLEVSRVDEAMFQYKQTYTAYANTDPEGLIGMFTEPVRVYTNVKNGVGVVCAQSQPVTLCIDLTEN
jgi:hypothetical protein